MAADSLARGLALRAVRGVVTRDPLSGTSSSQVLYDASAPTGQTNSIGGDDGVVARIAVTSGQFTQGPTGHANYYDTVLGFGLNITTAWAKVNATIPACSIRFESKFAQGGASDPFGAEYHVAFTPTDSANERRVFSCFAPHLAADWLTKSEASHNAGQHSFKDGDGTAVLGLDFRVPTARVVDITGSTNNVLFRWGINNKAILQQYNAAGNAYVSLPYLDSNDTLRSGTPVVINGAFKTSSVSGGLALLSAQGSGAGSGSRMIHMLSSAAVSGSLYAFYLEGDATADWVGRIYNNRSGGVAAMDLVHTSGSGEYRIAGTKVVGARGAAVADATDAASAITQLNALLARCRAHGLIAT